jgi:hypothetical protein
VNKKEKTSNTARILTLSTFFMLFAVEIIQLYVGSSGLHILFSKKIAVLCMLTIMKYAMLIDDFMKRAQSNKNHFIIRV